MDRSHLFPHRETYKIHNKQDYVTLGYPQQSNIKVDKHMLKTTATPRHVTWHRKLYVILANKILCSKFKMRVIKLMVTA